MTGARLARTRDARGTTMDQLERALERRRIESRLPEPAVRKRLRLLVGLTQREVATAVGVSQQAINAYEGGTRRPSGTIAERYVAVLDRLRELDSPASAGRRGEVGHDDGQRQ
jgi:DNA-binding XRE family transcriptional regulator